MGPRSCLRPSTLLPCMSPSRLCSPCMPPAVPQELSWTLGTASPTPSPSTRVTLFPMPSLGSTWLASHVALEDGASENIISYHHAQGFAYFLGTSARSGCCWATASKVGTTPCQLADGPLLDQAMVAWVVTSIAIPC